MNSPPVDAPRCPAASCAARGARRPSACAQGAGKGTAQWWSRVEAYCRLSHSHSRGARLQWAADVHRVRADRGGAGGEDAMWAGAEVLETRAAARGSHEL
eukprot:tig00000826_g4592.t1